MSGFNRVIALGNLGKDPEVKFTPAGKAVCNFSIAVNETWKDKDGQKQERTEWIRVVCWDKLAELCGQYLAKGRQAMIEGRLQTREYTDKEGVKKYSTEVVANVVQFIGGKESNGNGMKEAPAQGLGGVPIQEESPF